MSDADAQVWRQAEPLGRRCKFSANETIYLQGMRSTVFYFVLEGKIKLSTCFPDGVVFVLDVQGRNGLFGDIPAITGWPTLGTATAIEPTELLQFDIHHVTAAAQDYPLIAPSFLKVLAARQYTLTSRLHHMSHMDSEMRIGELFHRLAARQPGPEPVLLTLTHEQIGSLTGFNRVTVSRVLKRMRERGVIDVVKGRIQIIDADQLVSAKKTTP